MSRAMGPWRFLGRWISTAFSHSMSRTGKAPAPIVYAVLGAVIGFYSMSRTSGPSALLDQIKTWVTFTCVASVGSWAVAMLVSLLTAPFHMYREDHEASERDRLEREGKYANERQDQARQHATALEAIRLELSRLSETHTKTASERDDLKHQLATRDAAKPTITVPHVRMTFHELIKRSREDKTRQSLPDAKALCRETSAYIRESLIPSFGDSFDNVSRTAPDGHYRQDSDQALALARVMCTWLEQKQHVITADDLLPAPAPNRSVTLRPGTANDVVKDLVRIAAAAGKIEPQSWEEFESWRDELLAYTKSHLDCPDADEFENPPRELTQVQCPNNKEKAKYWLGFYIGRLNRWTNAIRAGQMDHCIADFSVPINN
jgi:hypothetical protein